MKNLDITEIVQASILQKLPDSFYNATGFVTAIHDCKGNLITSIAPSSYCSFCRGMFFSKDGHNRCVESNRQGAKKALEFGGVYVYECHAGLTDVAAPVIIDGVHVASVSSGQILLEELTDQSRQYIRNKLEGLPSTVIDKQMKALESTRVVSMKQIQGIAELLSSLANSIVDLVIKNVSEKANSTKKSLLIDSIKFNAMLDNQRQEAQIRLRESELKFLQSQINPHFLYNTLDSIHWLAVLQRNDDILETVGALSNLLRQSLDYRTSVLTLKEEVDNVKNYLYIQKIRLEHDLHYEIEVESSILDFKIPKLVLQPLVENSLKHGLGKKNEGVCISIFGWMRPDGDAEIEISDNGMGISNEQLELIMWYLKVKKIPTSQNNFEGTGIGLLNVQERLTYYFPQFEGIFIESKIGEGTRIKFYISKTVLPQLLVKEESAHE